MWNFVVSYLRYQDYTIVPMNDEVYYSDDDLIIVQGKDGPVQMVKNYVYTPLSHMMPHRKSFGGPQDSAHSREKMKV